MYDIDQIKGDAAHLDKIRRQARECYFDHRAILAIGRQTVNVYTYRGTFFIENHDGETIVSDLDATMAASIAYTLDHA